MASTVTVPRTLTVVVEHAQVAVLGTEQGVERVAQGDRGGQAARPWPSSEAGCRSSSARSATVQARAGA